MSFRMIVPFPAPLGPATTTASMLGMDGHGKREDIEMTQKSEAHRRRVRKTIRAAKSHINTNVSINTRYYYRC